MIGAVILDLDGTVYRGATAVPGAARFVARLRERGGRCLFVTNRANRGPAEVRDQLRGCGIPCEAHDVLTSAQATARYLGGGRVFCIGEEPLVRELAAAGIALDERAPDTVVVGLDRRFDYGKLRLASRLIRAGARFVATNADKGLRIEDEVIPGTGAIVAAVAAASGVEPVVVGKPQPLIIAMALQALGAAPDQALVVGDNLATDIPAGRRAGVRTALLLTGISTRADLAGAPDQPTWVAEGFEELERIVFDGERP